MGVTLVSNQQVSSLSKHWSVILIPVDEILSALSNKFLLHIQGKEEGFWFNIIDPFATKEQTVNSFPLQIGVASNSFAKLGPDQYKSVGDVITDLMESSSFEAMFRRSEEETEVAVSLEDGVEKYYLLFRTGLKDL